MKSISEIKTLKELHETFDAMDAVEREIMSAVNDHDPDHAVACHYLEDEEEDELPNFAEEAARRLEAAGFIAVSFEAEEKRWVCAATKAYSDAVEALYEAEEV